MYIPDEVVVQLYNIAKKIPTEYGYKPYAILSEVIVNNEKMKEEKKHEHDKDVSTLPE